MKDQHNSPGEGTIYENKKRGQWVAQLTLPTGKRKTFYGQKKSEVQAKLRQLKREVDAGLYGTTDADQPLKDYLVQYVQEKRHTLRQRSLIQYDIIIRLHLDGIGHIPLNKLTPNVLRKHYIAKLEEMKPVSVLGIHHFIRSALEVAVENDILPKNPAKRGIAPTVIKRKYVTLTLEQVTTLLSATRGHRFEGAIALGFASGLREAEVLGLRWQDIHWTQNQITIASQLIHAKRQFSLGDPKTESSGTTIHVPGYILRCLHARKIQQEEDREIAGGAWENSWNLVFTNSFGHPIYANTLRRSFQRILAENGLPFMRFHDLRHTYGTLLIQEGVPLNTVSQLMRHASPTITAELYIHVTPKMHEDAHQKLTSMLPADFIDLQSLSQSFPPKQLSEEGASAE